jgi:hypothetical protein
MSCLLDLFYAQRGSGIKTVFVSDNRVRVPSPTITSHDHVFPHPVITAVAIRSPMLVRFSRRDRLILPQLESCQCNVWLHGDVVAPLSSLHRYCHAPSTHQLKHASFPDTKLLAPFVEITFKDMPGIVIRLTTGKSFSTGKAAEEPGLVRKPVPFFIS